jgi:hypothetical protein
MRSQVDAPAKDASIEIQKKNDNDKMTTDQKRLFIVFTKVLLRYLQKKDPVAYLLARQTIREAVDHERRSTASNTCPVSRMKRRLEVLVSKEHWKKAEDYLLQKLKTTQASDENSDSIEIFGDILDSSCVWNSICS